MCDRKLSCKPASKASTLVFTCIGTIKQHWSKCFKKPFRHQWEPVFPFLNATHGNSLSFYFLSDALSGLVSSPLRRDSLQSVKASFLATAVGVQSPNVACCTLSRILFSAGVRDPDDVWLQTPGWKQHCEPGIVPTCRAKRMWKARRGRGKTDAER